MDKTDQTFAVITKKCQQIYSGEWPIKLYIWDGQIIGFDELDRALIKFRASKEGKKITGDE